MPPADLPTQLERTVASLRVHVNEKGDGPPLVILHHSTGPLWTTFHDRLAESFLVVAPDLPGFGRSERPSEARSPRDLGILTLQLLDVLGIDSCLLVGLGFGGWVAAEMATMHQRRFSGLVLVGPPGLKPTDGFIHDPMMASFADYMRLGFADESRFEELFGGDPDKELVDLWDFSREMTARLTWKQWMWSGELPLGLRGVATPALVVFGVKDRIVPLDCGEQYAKLLQNARLEVLEDAGHNVELEQPDVLAGLVADFATAGR